RPYDPARAQSAPGVGRLGGGPDPLVSARPSGIGAHGALFWWPARLAPTLGGLSAGQLGDGGGLRGLVWRASRATGFGRLRRSIDPCPNASAAFAPPRQSAALSGPQRDHLFPPALPSGAPSAGAGPIGLAGPPLG